MEDRMLKWFSRDLVDDQELQEISLYFSDLVSTLVIRLQPGPERTVALRKLLEAKDAAIRATIHPGG